MSFLAPFFLLGAAAIALPVVFHLIRRSSRERVPFSSLMFLLPTPPRVTRRSKLENVLLLLLRCLVIGLLATAFARPFLSRPVAPDPASQQGQKLVVLIDASASMRRGNLWAAAKAKAKSILRNAAPADQLACYTFARDLHPVMSFEQWSAVPPNDRAPLLEKQLDDIQPGWASTRLGNALINACELFEVTTKDDRSARQVILITDLQEGSRLDGLQGYEWPRGVQVTIEVLPSGGRSNAGLQLAFERQDVEKSSLEPVPRVRITNASDSKREQFQVGWQTAAGGGFTGSSVDAYIAPGQSRVVAVPRPTNNAAADRIVLTGDEDDFDNRVYVIPSESEKARILFIGSESEQDPAQLLYYLRRAFQETRRLAVEVQSQNPSAPLTEKELAGVRLLVIKEPLPEAQLQAVQRFLSNDRSVLLVLTSPALAPTLGQLAGTDAIKLEEAPASGYAMLGQIDFTHPIFVPFADPRYSDFTKIHFWKHRIVNFDQIPKVRVLARFDEGSPALTEVPSNKGKLWILASGWQPDDSQLALSSKFVPLVYAMLEQSGAVKDQPMQYTVGDAIPLAGDADSVTIRKPDASEVRVAHGETFTGTDQPGIYTVASAEKSLRFAVNLAPEESKTAPLALEELERLGVPLQHQFTPPTPPAQQRREHLQAVQLESRQKLWRWLIVAALMLLVMETWLAGRLTRPAVSVVQEPSSA